MRLTRTTLKHGLSYEDDKQMSIFNLLSLKNIRLEAAQITTRLYRPTGPPGHVLSECIMNKPLSYG